jgi:hypothetical protein
MSDLEALRRELAAVRAAGRIPVRIEMQGLTWLRVRKAFSVANREVDTRSITDLMVFGLRVQVTDCHPPLIVSRSSTEVEAGQMRT